VRGIGAYCLRPRFIFGRGDQHTLPGLIRLVRRGIRLGTGEQRFSIIDVDDYARVLLALAERLYLNGVAEQAALNLAYTQPVSLNEIFSVICHEFKLPPPWIRIPVRRWMMSGLHRFPAMAAESLATKLELFSFSHTFRVDKLSARIGSEIPSGEPIAALRSAASYQQPVSHAIEATHRCYS
jgi:nucleoside-diphosphate-sugar epimerase